LQKKVNIFSSAKWVSIKGANGLWRDWLEVALAQRQVCDVGNQVNSKIPLFFSFPS